MTLTDTGPLVALLDADDPHYNRCITVIARSPLPLVVTWACFTEAMYLLGRSLGTSAQSALWEWVDDGTIFLHTHTASEIGRMRDLMAQYADRPMDFADASLLAASETLQAQRVFSIDSDFFFYRTAGGRVLEVLPGPRPR